MKKRTIIRIAVGAAALAAGIILLATVYDPAMDRAHRITIATVFAALSLGGLATALIGWGAGLYGVATGIAIVLLQFFSGTKYAGLFAFALFTVPPALALLRRAARKRRTSEGDVPDPNGDVEEAEPEDVENEGNMLVLKTSMDSIYQLWRGADRLLLVRLGNVLHTDLARVIQSEAAFKEDRGNRAIPFTDITSIRLRFGPGNLRRLLIRTRSKALRFSVLEPETLDAVHFFANLPFERAGRARRPESLPTAPQGRVALYRKVTTALPYLGGACAAAWMFLDVPYKLFAAVNLAIPTAWYVFYCLYYDASASLKKDERERRAMMCWMIPTCALFLRLLFDFNFTAPAQFVAPAALISLTAAALFLAFNLRKKPSPRHWLSLAVGLLLFSVPAAGYVNYLTVNDAKTTREVAVVADMHVSHGSKAPDMYVLRVRLANRNLRLNVPQTLYEAVAVGDKVLVLTKTGELGITYAGAAAPEKADTQ